MVRDDVRRPAPADTLEGAVELMIRDQLDEGATYRAAADEVVRLLTMQAGAIIASRAGGPGVRLERGLVRASRWCEQAAREFLRRGRT